VPEGSGRSSVYPFNLMSILARSSVFAAMVVVAAAPPALAQRMRAGDSFKDKVAAWRGDAQVSGKIVDDAGKGVPRRESHVHLHEVE